MSLVVKEVRKCDGCGAEIIVDDKAMFWQIAHNTPLYRKKQGEYYCMGNDYCSIKCVTKYILTPIDEEV